MKRDRSDQSLTRKRRETIPAVAAAQGREKTNHCKSTAGGSDVVQSQKATRRQHIRNPQDVAADIAADLKTIHQTAPVHHVAGVVLAAALTAHAVADAIRRTTLGEVAGVMTAIAVTRRTDDTLPHAGEAGEVIDPTIIREEGTTTGGTTTTGVATRTTVTSGVAGVAGAPTGPTTTAAGRHATTTAAVVATAAAVTAETGDRDPRGTMIAEEALSVRHGRGRTR